MNKGIKINKGLCNFLIETFKFTDEQLAAIDYQIPMTQEIYDSILVLASGDFHHSESD